MENMFFNKEIKHVKQSTKNDCGHACLKMAFNYICNEIQSLETIISKLELNDVSLWTIDIAHICAIRGFKHSMYTITLGVEDSYETYDFYTKDKNFNNEKQRINNKFQQAAQLNINVKKQTISLDYIKNEIHNAKCVCILLVNTNKLIEAKNYSTDDEFFFDELEQKSFLSCCLFRKSPSTKNYILAENNDYCGHFIVVVGFDDSRNLIYYRNPAFDKQLSIIDQGIFEQARKSFGTDEDILFIYK